MGRRRTGDKISSLPDEILCHFLSFLSTQQAVTTSVLSKRWTHLWLHVLNVDFTDIKVDSIESNHRLNESVYSVLASRYAAHSEFIDNFNLNIRYTNHNFAYSSYPNVIKWINIVVQRRLKHLHLHLLIVYSDSDSDDNEDDDDDDDDDDDAIHQLPKLPISIFTCKTLVSLDLRRFSVKGFSFSSIGFGFPSLEKLSLNGIEFVEDGDFMLLLSGCPVLEELELFRSYLNCEENCLTLEFQNLSLPKLTRADITQCLCSCFPLNALSTSESLRLDTMILYTKVHEVYEVSQLPDDDIPIFHNLTYLELDNSWNFVVQMLHHCPMLQNLKILEGYVALGNVEDCVEPEFVPQCLLSHLRTCTIQDKGGLQSEFMLAKYILKNAKLLQTMTISSEIEQHELERKFSSCPKASAKCQILVKASAKCQILVINNII